MFTTGSKFFFGAAILATVSAVVYGTSSGNPIFTGTIVLVGLAVVASFLGGVVVSFRDANRPAVAGTEALAPTHQVAPYSIWPIALAFALGTVALGIAVDNRAFLLGLAGLLVVGIEWVVQGWSDGASADPGYNRAVRGKFMHAIEFPVVGALGVGFVGFMFSRLMLTLTEDAAVVAFIVVGVLVFAGAIILAGAPQAAKKALPVFAVVGAAGLLAAGVVGIARGEADHAELHEKTGNAVALKSNPAEVITMAEDTEELPQIVIPKGITANLLFRNDAAEPHKLVVVGKQAVKVGTKTEIQQFTAQTEAIKGGGKTALLTVHLPKSGEFDYYVADEAGTKVATGKVVVP